MKFNTVCVKFDKNFFLIPKKPTFWTFEFLIFFKPLKTRFFEAIFQPGTALNGQCKELDEASPKMWRAKLHLIMHRTIGLYRTPHPNRTPKL